ncbi:MAG TPA: ACT domain-containing protein [Polyangia bacterium]
MKDVDLRRIVAEVTREVAAQADRGGKPAAANGARRGGRAVVTTTGKNQRGIVARIAQAIADAGGDIVDISQTLVSDYFTMIIIVDIGSLSVSFAEFKAKLERTVATAGAECLVMHEDIVNALQRV